MILLLTVLSFFIGSLPFSLWVGRFLLGKDIRLYGDNNPGATNVLRAGGFWPFTLALILDISKGAAPVGLAFQIWGIQDWAIIPIALAPTIGHAFSPFLNWRGGKALAVSLGVWIGLTLWIMPAASLLLLIFWSLVITPSAWAVLLTLAGMFFVALFWLGNPLFVWFWLLQTAVILWMQRTELKQSPRLRFLKANHA